MPAPFYSPGGIVHWDDVEVERFDIGPLRFAGRDLGRAAGAHAASVVRYEIDPGARSSPAHSHGAEEELFFVLGGSGLSWEDGVTYEVRAGDAIIYRPLDSAHTLIAGDDGLDVLAFGPAIDIETTHLPRAGVVRINQNWVLAESDPEPWEREAAAGEIDLPGAPSPRPDTIVALDDLEPELDARGSMHLYSREIGQRLQSVTTGMSHITVAAGKASYPLHCHSAEEEIFVVLDGHGEAEIGDERIELRRGSVVARPPGTRVAHRFHAAPDSELVYLAWGTRVSADIAWYPNSRKLNFRGVGVLVRVDAADYFDGEE